MGSKMHVKNAIRVVEVLITEGNAEAKLKLTARNPFPSGYKPEPVVTPELKNKLGLCSLQLIGILRWAIELGRLDIFVKVSQLSQHEALPRRGHLEALYHIFAYLKKHENGARIVFDPKTPGIDERMFNSNANWRDFHVLLTQITQEMLSLNNRVGGTGIIICVQNAPIIWFTK